MTAHTRPNKDDVPDIVLERYRLKELPPNEASQIEDRIQWDEPLRRRLAALAQSDEDIRRRYPPDWMATRIGDRAGKSGAAEPARRNVTRSAIVWAPLVAAAAVMALVIAVTVVPRIAERSSSGTEPADIADGAEGSADRIKGLHPGLAVYRQTTRGSETLADGAVAHAGDLVRVGYRAAGKPFGVIFSIDGRGNVTLHLPPTGDRAAPLAREATVLLDQAYELDDAPLWERFYFITGEAPFAVAPILESAQRAAGARGASPAALTLPHGLEQSTFSLQKGPRP
jgi:hypothetical protein